MPKINWEKEIWEWATKEFPHIHSDKFEELFKIINQARQEERERAFDILMSCMPKTTENISTIIPEDARKMLQDFVKKYWS